MADIPTPNPTASSAAVPFFLDGAQAITPSATDTFHQPVHVYVGGAGIVVCTPANGNTEVSVTVPAGGWVPFRVTSVKATSTATLMVAVY